MRRKNVSASPKVNSAGKGQGKQASDTSDVERARNKRRRRKSLRKINQSPSSDEAGQGKSLKTVEFPSGLDLHLCLSACLFCEILCHLETL